MSGYGDESLSMTEVDVDAAPVFNHKRNELMSAVPDISKCDKANLITSRTVSVGLTDKVLVCKTIKTNNVSQFNFNFINNFQNIDFNFPFVFSL